LHSTVNKKWVHVIKKYTQVTVWLSQTFDLTTKQVLAHYTVNTFKVVMKYLSKIVMTTIEVWKLQIRNQLERDYES
jgi:hypothetical protein